MEVAEGLVIGPDDKLVVLLKDGLLYEEGAFESFSDDLRRVLGDRFIIIAGPEIEIAKVSPAVHAVDCDLDEDCVCEAGR